MPSSAVVFGVSALYLAVCLGLGLWPGRKASASAAGYVAGDRTLGLVLMYFITGATIFSAFAFLGAPGWAYSRGAAAFYILGYGALGFAPLYFLGPRAARLGRAWGFVTQAEMVSARVRSPAVAGVMAAISVVAFVPYLALQMKGAGYVLSAVTREAIPDWAGAALVYGVVLIYVLRSGVLGVGWTNTFQGLFMMVLAWGLGLYLPHALYGGVGPMFDRLAAERPELLLAPSLTSGGEPWSWGEYSSAIVVSVVGFSVWPHLFMKAFTARDERTIRRTVVLYPTFQVFLVPLFLIGFCGVFFESAPERADQVLPHMLMNMELPALLVGLFCAGALAASMSSGDAVVQFAPAVVATLYARKVDAHGVLAGLLAGSAVTVVLVLWPDLRPWPVHAGLYGLAVNLAALGIVTRWFGRGGSLDLRAFYDGIVPADEADGDGDGQRICEGDCGQQAGRAVPRPSVQDRRAVRYAPLPRV